MTERNGAFSMYILMMGGMSHRPQGAGNLSQRMGVEEA